jgi:hypothetical protein
MASFSLTIGTLAGYPYLMAMARRRRIQCPGEYDALGQVRSGRKYWSDQTPVAGQQFEYARDDAGNRTSTKAGGDPAMVFELAS